MSQDYNGKMQFPTNDNFVNRITEVEFTDSKRSGNGMIHYTCEVVSPETVTIGEKEVNIAGVVTEQYLVTHNWQSEGVLNEEKTDSSRERIEKLWADCGQDPKSINWNNPDLSWMKGAVILTAMGCDVNPQRKSPTPEQRAKNQEGDIMTNPVTKKPLVFYKPKIIEVFGLAPEGVAVGATGNKPY